MSIVRFYWTCSTATEPGYSGRVFCVSCGAVLEEGRKIPATCHTYSVDVPGQRIVCGCGCTFTETGLQTVDGESYYTINGKLLSGWQTVDGEWYYFHKTTYAGLNGNQYADNGVQFIFENGRLTSGVWVTTSSGTRYWYGPGYYKDSSADAGSSRPYEIDGKIYLFNRYGYMQTGIVPYPYAYGGSGNVTLYYDCGTTGEAVLLTGPYNDYFYYEGVRQIAYKVVEYSGSYYYISDGNRLAKNVTLYLNKVLAGTGLPAGQYTFDAEGKMIIPETPEAEVKNGVVGNYFYINDVKQLAYQLIEYEGYYYYIGDGHKVAKNTTLYLNKVLAGTGLPSSSYSFDSEGRMILPEPSHAEVIDPSVTPTCTEAGLTDG